MVVAQRAKPLVPSADFSHPPRSASRSPPNFTGLERSSGWPLPRKRGGKRNKADLLFFRALCYC